MERYYKVLHIDDRKTQSPSAKYKNICVIGVGERAGTLYCWGGTKVQEVSSVSIKKKNLVDGNSIVTQKGHGQCDTTHFVCVRFREELVVYTENQWTSNPEYINCLFPSN